MLSSVSAKSIEVAIFYEKSFIPRQGSDKFMLTLVSLSGIPDFHNSYYIVARWTKNLLNCLEYLKKIKSHNRKALFYGLSIHPIVHLKYIQAFSRAFKFPPYNCILVICRALKSLNVNACRVNSNTLYFMNFQMKK